MASSYPLPKESRILLWAGEDPALHANLLEKLEAAGIPFLDDRIGDDRLPPLPDPLPIDWKPRFGFEVAVQSSDFPLAKEILEPLLMQDSPDLEIPAQDDAPQAAPAVTAQTGAVASQEFVAQVWSGMDERVAGFLMASLEENQIPAHLEKDAAGMRKIFVAPLNEARAREIVREVIQGAPPQ